MTFDRFALLATNGWAMGPIRGVSLLLLRKPPPRHLNLKFGPEPRRGTRRSLSPFDPTNLAPLLFFPAFAQTLLDPTRVAAHIQDCNDDHPLGGDFVIGGKRKP